MGISRYVRNRALLCLSILIGVCSLFLAASSTASAAPNAAAAVGTLNGTAYAAYVQTQAGSGVASVGPLLPVSLSCSLSSQTVTNSGSLAPLGFGTAGTATDTVTTTNSATAATVVSSANVQSLNLLSGAITADAVHAIANTSANTTTASSTNTSTFGNLVIGGVPVSSTPAPNTKVALPGIGMVTVNEQVGPTNSANASSITVIGLDVNITTATQGLPVGTHILIAYATSGYVRTIQPATLSAYAYGLYDTIPPVTNGPFAAVGLGCAGGNNTATLASVSLPPISTGTMTSQAFGSTSVGGSTATGQSSISNPSVTGLLQATQISARATASFTPALHGYTGYAVTLTGASLLGGTIPLSSSPAPNTRVTIPGIGTAFLNEQSITTNSTSAKIIINAIDIMVTSSNALGLPVGTRIILGHADASVTSNL